jgi:hypothetical protein
VVRISGGYDAGNAGHGGILAQGESGGNRNMGSVPRFPPGCVSRDRD